MKELTQGFITAAQDSNPGPHSRETEALPLNHYAYYNAYFDIFLCFKFV